jgi:hypothetical protein
MSGVTRQRSNAISGNSLRPVLPNTGKTPVVFAGHGAFYAVTDAKYPKVRLPPGVTLVFWCHHGASLSNLIAQYVEQNKPLSKLPELMQKIVAKDRSPAKPGEVSTPHARWNGLPEIVQGGSEIWNYRLTYPSGLELGSQPGAVKASRYNAPVSPVSRGESAHSYVKGVIRDNNYCIVPSLSGGIKDSGVPIIAMLAGYWSICNNNVVHWCACRLSVDL